MIPNYIHPSLKCLPGKSYTYSVYITLDTADLLDYSWGRKDHVLALSSLPADLSTLPFFLFVFFSSRLESLFSPSLFFVDVYQRDAES